MGKTIYMEDTMILLTDSMKFPTQEALDAFLEKTFIAKFTREDQIYYQEKELESPTEQID